MSNRSTVDSKTYCRSVKSYLKQIGNFLYSLRLLYSLSLLVDLLSNIPLLSIITRPSQAKPPTRPPFCLISALQTFDLTISVVVLPQYSDLRSNLSKVHVLTCTISTKMIALNVYQSSTIKSPILSHLNYPPSFKTGSCSCLKAQTRCVVSVVHLFYSFHERSLYILFEMWNFFAFQAMLTYKNLEN